MIRTKSRFSICLFFLGTFSMVWAQEVSRDPYEKEVQSLVSFYKYMLNTVGGSRASARDKEVVITESYKKAFRDGFVQVEDDLLPDRNAITNKDIGAYLRDVDFFFKNIEFSFEELEVSKGERTNGEAFYLVAFQSKIEATTLEGVPYQRTGKRYMEVNFNEANDDLKIVSVYSTKVSREKELRNWWETLSFEWTRIFQEYVPMDSISDEALQKMADLDSLNLADNQFIQSIKPLSALKRLKYLNVSNTKISDLRPLRYASQLHTLLASGSLVSDISIISYFEGLKTLDLSRTNVSSVEAIGNTHLEKLVLSGTDVVVFDALSQLKSLQYIDLSNTSFSDGSWLVNNEKLKHADLSRTGIASLRALGQWASLSYLNVSESYLASLAGAEQLVSLEEIHLNQTRVSSLEPLTALSNLKKIYADYTGINERGASGFMARHPGVLVITNSEKIMEWWSALEPEWKVALNDYLPVNATKEDLAKLINRDSLDVSNKLLVDGTPLSRFTRLKYLDISRNLITNFGFTRKMADLECLKAVKFPNASTAGLEHNKNLKRLILSESVVQDLRPLESLSKLELVDVVATEVSESSVKELLGVSPHTVVLYQPAELMRWWQELPTPWKEAFDLEAIDSFHLHQLIESCEVRIDNGRIVSLSPLNVFVNLRKVHLDRTGIKDLSDLAPHEHLEEIICKNGPLMNLQSIDEHYELKKLDISNTAISDLSPLKNNKSLTHLNCSGTNVKSLKGVDQLYSLNYLDISNTRVWRMDRLYDLRSLNVLVCNNTRIRSRIMQEFKSDFPECEITYY